MQLGSKYHDRLANLVPRAQLPEYRWKCHSESRAAPVVTGSSSAAACPRVIVYKDGKPVNQQITVGSGKLCEEILFEPFMETSDISNGMLTDEIKGYALAAVNRLHLATCHHLCDKLRVFRHGQPTGMYPAGVSVWACLLYTSPSPRD